MPSLSTLLSSRVLRNSLHKSRMYHNFTFRCTVYSLACAESCECIIRLFSPKFGSLSSVLLPSLYPPFVVPFMEPFRHVCLFFSGFALEFLGGFRLQGLDFYIHDHSLNQCMNQTTSFQIRCLETWQSNFRQKGGATFTWGFEFLVSCLVMSFCFRGVVDYLYAWTHRVSYL